MRPGPIDPSQRRSLPNFSRQVEAGKKIDAANDESPIFSVGKPEKSERAEAPMDVERPPSFFGLIRRGGSDGHDAKRSLSSAFQESFRINDRSVTNVENLDALAEAVLDDPTIGKLVLRLLQANSDEPGGPRRESPKRPYGKGER